MGDARSPARSPSAEGEGDGVQAIEVRLRGGASDESGFRESKVVGLRDAVIGCDVDIEHAEAEASLNEIPSRSAPNHPASLGSWVGPSTPQTPMKELVHT
jgi:hypothetical protein